MDPNDKPGILGYLYRGSYIVAIHANWPAYPPPHKVLALYDLGQFPEGTGFVPIDEIDQCTLFRASCGPIYDNPYDERSFHVAIWNEDLLELTDAELIRGVRTVTQIEKLRAQRSEMEAEIADHLASEGIDPPKDPLATTFVPHGDVRHSLAEFWDRRILEATALVDEWESWERRDILVQADPPVSITTPGWSEIATQLANESSLATNGRLVQLYDLGLYDTAVRDGSVMLESTLRDVTGIRSSGIPLVDAFGKKLLADPTWPNWAALRFRNDLRTIFKFVRNQFAHEIVEVSPIRARVLLDRISLLIDAVKESGSDAHSEDYGK
jgi:hypothetical protein